jgi:tripartite-type tricarboxylate transporter receptor subunit TctC
MRSLKLLASCILSVLVIATARPASSQPANGEAFPTKIVKMIVPYPAGGGVDIMARALSERLARNWGQTVIVENKPGASTMIAGVEVSRAAPDGYTLFLTSDQSITSNPFLFKKMLYDPVTQLSPVSQIIDLHQLVLVNPSVKANTLKEFVDYALAHPNELNYASYGVGSQPHLLFEMLRKATGAQIQQVSYRGIAPALTAVIANEVQTTLGTGVDRGGLIASGKLKPIALSRPVREKTLPNVPTLSESGFPQIDPHSWFGLFAPPNLPPELLKKISRDVAQIINDPEFRTRFISDAGFTGVGSNPEQFAKFIADDLSYKRNLIATVGIKPE